MWKALVWKRKVRMHVFTRNKWKLFRIQTEIIYVSPEIVTPQFFCFITFASGTQESQMFLRKFFSLEYIHLSPFLNAACWCQGEKKGAVFFLKLFGFKICPCVSVRVYHWHLLTKLKNTALSDGNRIQLCIVAVKATVDSKIWIFLMYSNPESRLVVWC